MAFLALCVFSSQTRKDECFVLTVTLGYAFDSRWQFSFFLLGKNIKRRKKTKQTKQKLDNVRQQVCSWIVVFALHCFCFLVGPGRCVHLSISLFQSHTAFALSPDHICQRLFWHGFRGDVFHVIAYLGLVEFYFFQSLHMEQCQLNSQI